MENKETPKLRGIPSGISCGAYHYPLVGDTGLIQCTHCLAFFENGKVIGRDLRLRLGRELGKKELKRLRRIQKKILRGTIEEEPTLFEFTGANGKIDRVYFYL